MKDEFNTTEDASVPFSGISSARAAQAATPSVSLRIIATSDVHMHLRPHCYYADEPLDERALALLAPAIRAARSARPGAILLDNGDFLQGTPMGDVAAAAGMSPAVTCMNALGYDAATLGNHEFNFGLPVLRQALAAADFPIVSANIVRAFGPEPTQDIPFLPPSVLLHRHLKDTTGRVHKLRIGIVGLLPPQTTTWDRTHLRGALLTRSIVEAASAHVRDLRLQGADVVVALCHSGLSGADTDPGAENAARALARTGMVDAIVAGHSHLSFPSPDHAEIEGLNRTEGMVYGTPLVMPKPFAASAGVIDLDLTRVAGTWIVAQSDSHLLFPEDDAFADPAILEATQPAHVATLNHIRTVVGRCEEPLTSYFSQVTTTPSLRLVLDAQRAYAQDVLRDTALSALPLISVTSPAKAGGRNGVKNYTDIAAGQISRGNIASIYPFTNSVAFATCTGTQLFDWVVEASKTFERVPLGMQDAPLLSATMPSYRFDVFDGLEITFDVSQPEGPKRVASILHDGRPLRPDAHFVIVANDHRIALGGHFTPSFPVLEDTVPLTEVIERFLARGPLLRETRPPLWRFSPLPDTTAVFQSSPKADQHLEDVTTLALSPAGRGERGFSKYRLHLDPSIRTGPKPSTRSIQPLESTTSEVTAPVAISNLPPYMKA